MKILVLNMNLWFQSLFRIDKSDNCNYPMMVNGFKNNCTRYLLTLSIWSVLLIFIISNKKNWIFNPRLTQFKIEMRLKGKVELLIYFEEVDFYCSTSITEQNIRFLKDSSVVFKTRKLLKMSISALSIIFFVV